jgi:hypothetical protein
MKTSLQLNARIQFSFVCFTLTAGVFSEQAHVRMKVMPQRLMSLQFSYFLALSFFS